MELAQYSLLEPVAEASVGHIPPPLLIRNYSIITNPKVIKIICQLKNSHLTYRNNSHRI